MHPNPAFRGVEAARNIEFARERGFGMLTLAGAEGPLASHVPFTLSPDGAALGAHVVKSNPIWRRLREGPVMAVMAVNGPDGYISPDWYETPDQVPTWNYVAVHLRGALRLVEDDRLRGHLDALSEQFEARLAPKPIWKTDKVAPEALSRMLRMLAPVEMAVDGVEGTWKLGQNKPEGAAERAAAGLATSDIGSELGALAALMKTPPG